MDNVATKHQYLNRVIWLWRNPAYGFDHDILGFKVNDGYTRVEHGDKHVSNKPLTNGWCYRTLVNTDGTRCWQFYCVYSYFNWKCFRLNIGWKIWGTPNKDELAQFVCSINPWMEFTKE
jgi:hypothetical protein